MNEICDDNRFEIIEAAKNKLIEATNIEMCPDEMAVLDSILFRMWQMGWLPGQERTCHMEYVFEDVDGRKIPRHKCSNCMEVYPIRGRSGNYEGNFCPNCGAKAVSE